MANPLLAGLTILMLGDSHFASQGYMITTLADELMRQGAQVDTEAACGAGTAVWTTTLVAPCGGAERVGTGPVRTHPGTDVRVPSLDELLTRFHPNLVVIGAGDTMAGYGQPSLPADYINQQISAITQRITAAGLPCVWIGPGWGTEGGPYFKTYARAQQMSEYLASHVAPCRYIDSLRFARPGDWATFDGQHYTLPGYQKWGHAVAEQIFALAQSH